MKKIYSFRDGLVLVSAAVSIANIDPKSRAADVMDDSGTLLVKGAPFSAKPADGCWSEIEEYVPGPPAPDERDARIAELEAKLADSHAKVAELEASKKQGKPDPK